jgi:CheY-like chemotaxis protein
LPLEDVEAICIVVTDLTEQEELLAAEQANEAKDQFLAALSHELRTPLTPVLMTVSAMELDDRLPEDVREGLAMLRRNVELEARLIDDLLDLTRIARGKVELKLTEVDLHEALRAALAICAPDIHEKKLRFSTDLQAARPRIKADAARVQQILWNLLRNAIKFTPPEGAISVATRNNDTGLELRIIDDGMGIEPDEMARIFEPFEQANRDVTRHFGGLGLGLAISRKFVEMHGGTLCAHSAGRGQGSTFVVTLPVGVEATVGSQPAAMCGCASDQANKGLRILLVEDHIDTASLLGKLLRRFGHDVAIANSRGEALRLAQDGSFDVMLSDIGLPDGTGHELMREIKHICSIPGIALTGYGMEEDVSRSRDAGFVEHVVKPINLDHLQAALTRATRR